LHPGIPILKEAKAEYAKLEKEIVELRATVRIETDDLTIENSVSIYRGTDRRGENGERTEVRTVPRDELASTIIDE